MLDIATRFSDRTRDYFLNNPMMSEKRRQPTETVALNAHRAGLEENQQKALTSVSYTHLDVYKRQPLARLQGNETVIV